MKPFTTIFWGDHHHRQLQCPGLWHDGLDRAGRHPGILFGEMMASPKSNEYTGKIAPPEKVAMYVGYFYWCVAWAICSAAFFRSALWRHGTGHAAARPDVGNLCQPGSPDRGGPSSSMIVRVIRRMPAQR